MITRLIIFRSALNLFLSWQVSWPSTLLWPSVPQITLRRRPHDLSAIPIHRCLHYEHTFCFRNSICGRDCMTCLPFPFPGASVMNTHSASAIHFAELAAWPVCHSYSPVPPLWTHVQLPQFTLWRRPHDLSAIPICRCLRYEYTFCFRNWLYGGSGMTCLPFPLTSTWKYMTCSASATLFPVPAHLTAWALVLDASSIHWSRPL